MPTHRKAGRKTTAFISACLLLPLVSACVPFSHHGPVNSTQFKQVVKQSLGDTTGAGVYKALRSSWFPPQGRDRVRGIFVISQRGLIFAAWNNTRRTYRPVYQLPYRGLQSVQLDEEGFKKRLRVSTRDGRVDHFEILTQSIKPPYVVDNKLTDKMFKLLEKAREKHTSERRGATKTN